MGGVDYQSVSLVAHSLGRSVGCILTAFVVGVLLWPGMGGLTLAFFGHALREAYPAYRGDGAFVYR